MTRYRTGAHWGVTIVREGPGPEDVMGHRSGDELVAVMTNGDESLAERICELLNREAETLDAIKAMVAPRPIAKAPATVRKPREVIE